MGRIIDTFDIILVAWLCFYFFRDIILFRWWIFFILAFIQMIFQALGDGLSNELCKKKKKKVKR